MCFPLVRAFPTVLVAHTPLVVAVLLVLAMEVLCSDLKEAGS